MSFDDPARFAPRPAERWPLTSIDFADLDRGKVVSTFGLDPVDDTASGPVRVEIMLDAEADLLVALVRAGGEVFSQHAESVGPSRAAFFIDVWWEGADIRVFEFRTSDEAEAFFRWFSRRQAEASMAEPPIEPGLEGMGGGGPAEPPVAEAPPPVPPPAAPARRARTKPRKKARGQRRAKPRAPGAAEAAPAPVAVPAHAMAEMPATARAGSSVEVRFTLSWLRVEPEPGAIVDDAEIELDPERPVTISISTHGFRLAKGTRRVRTVHLRRDHDKEVRTFVLEAVDVGVGEVTIVVRQGHETPLATLRLTPEIVVGAPADGAATASADAVPPDPAVTALPTISIDESLAAGEATLDIAVQVGDSFVRGEQRKIVKAVVVADTYEQISTLCARLKDEPDPDERMRVGLEELRAIGVGLSRRLLSREVREFLWKHVGELDHLVIQTTGEFDIPWEIVYISDPGDTVDGKPVDLDQFLGMRGATRWVYNTALPTSVRVGRGRAKYLCPSYRDRRLSLRFTQGEGQIVKSVFKAKVVRPGDAASMAKVIADGFDLLHFGGHGVWTAAPPDQRLLLARYRKTGAPPDGSSYSATDLRRDLPARAMVDTTLPAPMVFLNACDVGRLDTSSPGLGGFPEAFLRGGVGVLVGCCWAVDDKVAGHFVHDFYDALKTTDLAGAVSQARRKSLENADLSGLAYVAYAHPHTTVTIA